MARDKEKEKRRRRSRSPHRSRHSSSSSRSPYRSRSRSRSPRRRKSSRRSSRDSPRRRSRHSTASRSPDRRSRGRRSSRSLSPDSKPATQPAAATTASTLTPEQKAALEAAKKAATLQQQHLMQRQTQATQAAALAATAARTAAFQCRVYVGSLSYETTDEQLRTTFAPFGQIKSITMPRDTSTGRHKGFGFVEFMNPEAAQSVLANMAGFVLNGRPIKVGRPTNVDGAAGVASVAAGLGQAGLSLTSQQVNAVSQAASGVGLVDSAAALQQNPLMSAVLGQPSPTALALAAHAKQAAAVQQQAQIAAIGLGGTNPTTPLSNPIINNSNNQAPIVLNPTPRIYVGSIFFELSEQDVQSVFSAFGEIKSCHLIMDSATGRHKGYGFIEYTTVEAAEQAIKEMHDFELAGRRLKVGRATQASSTATPTANIANNPALNAALLMQLNPQLLQQAQQQLQQLAATTTTSTTPGASDQQPTTADSQTTAPQSSSEGAAGSRCVLLRNMVAIEDVDNELEGEVTDGCSKYGQVEKVVIFTEKNETQPALGTVKIFVLFKTPEEAHTAVNGLGGRWFGGKQITAELYPESLFEAEKYN